MNPLVTGIGGIVLLLFLFFIGVPIGFAMAIAGTLGFFYAVSPSGALHLVGADFYSNLSSYSLSAIPMFILMGCLAFSSGIGRKTYEAAYTVMGRLRGGLVVATITASAIFGAVCGSSAATVAAIGKTALPEMKKRNYNPVISSGALACSGSLGIMIPPSIPFVVYGIITELSIGKLFIAGILPGIMQCILFMITALIICYLKPGLGPAGEPTSLRQKLKSLLGLADAMILFLLVIGGLFAGIFSPTAAGSIGSAGAIVIGVANRELTWKKFMDGLIDALGLSCMIFILVIGALIFGHFITATNLSQGLVNFASGMSPIGIIVFISVIFFIMGCFIDMTPVLLLLVPLLYPLILKSGYDPIWFGVVAVTLCMIGIVTPPVATNIFVVKGMVGEEISMKTIIKGVFIFLIPLILSLVLLIAFPAISLFLPSFMTY